MNQKQKNNSLSFVLLSDGLGFQTSEVKWVKIDHTVLQKPHKKPEIDSIMQSQKLELTVVPMTSLGLVYVGKRMLAYMVDSVFHFSLFMMAVLLYRVKNQNFHLDRINHPTVFLLISLLFMLFHCFLMMFEEVFLKTTLGKAIFGFYLQGTRLKRFFRGLLFSPSFMFFGLGLIFIFFHPEKRCWHDEWIDLQPMKV